MAPALPLTREAVQSAHAVIKPHIHETPVVTNSTLDILASTPQSSAALVGTPWEGARPACPRFRFFFKCENLQRVGAFKARGAFHAISRLTDEEVRNGVVTNSSGNHSQALALAARIRGVPAFVVMPTISTPSKIAATKSYGATVIHSGSTSEEREAVMQGVLSETGAHYVPPYDHADIIVGQGTMALELEAQVADLLQQNPRLGVVAAADAPTPSSEGSRINSPVLHAVIAPLGGGGMLSGIATALAGTGTLVFGAEPCFGGADDGARALAASPPKRITSVKSLTIADGLRSPVGVLPWSVISNREKVRGVYAVTEEQILKAMRLVLERVKMVVEPSAVVGLATALYNEDFRGVVEREGGVKGWNVGIVLSGGNTTVEAMMDLFSEGKESKGGLRQDEVVESTKAKIGMEGG